MFRSSLASCLSEKHVYRGCQSTDDEPEASEGEASHRTFTTKILIPTNAKLSFQM